MRNLVSFRVVPRQSPATFQNLLDLSSLFRSLSVIGAMQPETSISDITIHLRRDTSPLSTSAITVRLSSGVDLGLVGSALGLDPNSLRLNGYYVSHSVPSYTSPGLLWGQLLVFFAQRGLPAGGGSSVGDAIVVQGKHMGSTGGNPFMKRRFCLETERPRKKRKPETNCKLNRNHDTSSTKRNLEFQLANSENESPPKKRELEAKYKPDDYLATKRSLISDDASVTNKKLKLECANAGTHKSYTDEHVLLKRKLRLETECTLKKRRLTNYKSNESVIYPMRRVIKPDEVQVPG